MGRNPAPEPMEIKSIYVPKRLLKNHPNLSEYIISLLEKDYVAGPPVCSSCDQTEVIEDKKNLSQWTRCKILNGELTYERRSLVEKCGCMSHPKFRNIITDWHKDGVK